MAFVRLAKEPMMENIFVFPGKHAEKAWVFLEEHDKKRGGTGFIVFRKRRGKAIFSFSDPIDSEAFEKFLGQQSLTYKNSMKKLYPRSTTRRHYIVS